MSVRVTTRHSESFDIHASVVDPAQSPYASSVQDYVSKVLAFYQELGIHSAIWATAEHQRPEYLELDKEFEYVLELDEQRVVAYVDELTWSRYLFGERDNFVYSTVPERYEMTSLIIPTPIRQDEVKARRRYRRTQPHRLDRYEVAEEEVF